MSDLPTREQCAKCGRRGFGFHSPLWHGVAGERWANSPLCLPCFAELGDERGLDWGQGLEIHVVSLVRQRKLQRSVREFPDASDEQVFKKAWPQKVWTLGLDHFKAVDTAVKGDT